MAFNPIINNAASQEMAMAGNLAVVSDLKELEIEKYKEVERPTDERNIAQKLADKGKTDVATEMIRDLASKIASSGITLNPETLSAKVGNRVKDEYDLLLARDKSDQSTDLTQLSSQYTIRKGSNTSNGQNGNENPDSSKGEVKDPANVKEYAAAYSSFVVSGGNDLKKKIDQIESRLRAEGFDGKELLNIQKSIKTSIRSEIAEQVKDYFFKLTLSKEKSVEWALYSRGSKDLLRMVEDNPKLGGRSFGGYQTHLKGMVEEMQLRGRDEMREFIKDDLEARMIEKNASDKNVDKEIEELIKLGKKMNFDFGKFTQEWQKQKLHLGMTPLNPSIFQGSAGDTNDERKRNDYQYTQEDEKEILINQLRALYMQRALKGDFLTQVETSFKIRKLKNGMIKLGLQIGDFERIEKEGVGVARMKAIEMLKEAFCERATLYELSGPAYALINKRIKAIIKTLERLGVDFSQTELDNIRDDANYQMFDTARTELEQCDMLAQSRPHPVLEKRKMLLVKLLKRLKEESGIEAFGFDLDRFTALKADA